MQPTNMRAIMFRRFCGFSAIGPRRMHPIAVNEGEGLKISQSADIYHTYTTRNVLAYQMTVALQKLHTNAILCRVALQATRMRHYSFATPQYANAFGGLPTHDSEGLRMATIKYLEKFDKKLWFDDPMQTIIDGTPCGGKMVDTTDAAGRVNGKQLIADDAVMSKLLKSLQALTDAAQNPLSPEVLLDYTTKVRAVEAILLSHPVASQLVGNQVMDFLKQDGITEIEESVQANHVERKLNDLLLKDQAHGEVNIIRTPVFVACVSNFSNFLDLFRKTIRHIELGVPCVVLSRSNTSQHCFRWFQLLLNLLKRQNLPLNLVTFASCSVQQQRQLFSAFPSSPTHFTGSREVAQKIKQVAPRLLASTGGPNTMVITGMTPQIADAVRMSACIENSGQCTALRHVVAACLVSEESVRDMFASVRTNDTPSQSLNQREFAALLSPLKVTSAVGPAGYSQVAGAAVAVKISNSLPEHIEEHWRQVFLDVTSKTRGEVESEEGVSELAGWLNKHQPISLSVNGSLELGRRLWEQSGVLVFTSGTLEAPALSCQARPQDGECFGEFPPRALLSEHTRFPMVVPTAAASYNASYTDAHLRQLADTLPVPPALSYLIPLLHTIQCSPSRGFCVALLTYLFEACQGPWRAHGSRTCLYGLQRPPLGQVTLVRVGSSWGSGDCWPLILPFLATTAREQLQVSVAPSSPVRAALEKWLGASGVGRGAVGVWVEDEAAFKARARGKYNVVVLPAVAVADEAAEFPLAAQFVSTLMMLGHVKSVARDDEAFIQTFEASEKWLRIRHSPF